MRHANDACTDEAINECALILDTTFDWCVTATAAQRETANTYVPPLIRKWRWLQYCSMTTCSKIFAFAFSIAPPCKMSRWRLCLIIIHALYFQYLRFCFAHSNVWYLCQNYIISMHIQAMFLGRYWNMMTCTFDRSAIRNMHLAYAWITQYMSSIVHNFIYKYSTFSKRF